MGFAFRRAMDAEGVPGATPGDACEFELTDNEYRRAIAVGHDGSKRYRIVFVQYATDPEKCRVLELPNPASEKDKSLLRIVGRSSVRMAFELARYWDGLWPAVA